MSLLLAALVTLPLSPSTARPAAPPAVHPADEPAALVIDGEPVPLSEYGGWLVRLRGESKAIEFVEEWALEQRAEKLGVVVPDEVVDAEVQAVLTKRITRSFGGDRARWEEGLARENRTVRGVKLDMARSLRLDMLARAILDEERVITDEMLREQWEYRHGPGGRSVEARVLRIAPEERPLPPGTPPAKVEEQRRQELQQARDTAEFVRGRIAGGEDFGKLARRYSVHPSASAGGALAKGFVPGEWPLDVVAQLVEQGVGLSPPIEGGGSWWLFQVERVTNTPFDAVAADLRAELLGQEPTQEEVGALIHETTVEVDWQILPAMVAAPADGTVARPDDEPVLLVDGRPIDRGTFTRWLRRRQGENMAPMFVERRVLLQMAAEREVALSDEELEALIDDEIERRFFDSGKKTKAEWEAQLASKGRSIALMRREMQLTHPPLFLAEKMILAEREIAEEQLRALWRERYGTEGRRIDARVIRLEVPHERVGRDGTDEERDAMLRAYEETKALAEELQKRLRAGEDFGTLARRYSDDASAEAGGAYPDGLVLTDWPPEVTQGLESMKPGAISDLFEVEDSICIFEVLENRVTPYESVRDSLFEELSSARPNGLELAIFRNVATRDVPFSVQPAMTE